MIDVNHVWTHVSGGVRYSLCERDDGVGRIGPALGYGVTDPMPRNRDEAAVAQGIDCPRCLAKLPEATG